MVQTEDGKQITDALTEEGIVVLGGTLLETGYIAFEAPQSPIVVSEQGFYYAKLGSTILISLKKDSFRITEELNKIPSFEFEISNCSANRTAIVAGITDVFRIYHRLNSVDTLMFTGIINGDAIEYLSLERIRITGYASYIDLNWRFHQHLNTEDAENVEKVYDYDGSFTDYTTEANNDTINDVVVSFNSIGHFFIGQCEQFFGMQVKYSTKGVQAANTTVVWEYSAGGDVWSTLDILDETRAFTEDVGTYYITIPHKPSDWAKEEVQGVNKFWIRAVVTAGSYTTHPKLDRIKITNTDVFRVYYFDTAADTIMDEVLDGTEYSMDVTDVCPSDTISIVAEYETKLRFIAGVANALTWDDSGDKRAYQWWIDLSKKVHFRHKRGTTLGDITSELTILNNSEDYFNLSNRLHFLGNYDGLNQIRAVIENTSSQDTHEIRELVVPEERYNNYIPLKEAAQKAMAYTKAPLQKIAATITTKYWVDSAFEVGDTVTLHHDRWNVDETAFQIVRADIGPRVTNLDMGISQEHLDGLKAGLQRRMDISGIRMHGSTSLLQFGPETMNYQRVNDSTVYYSKLKFEIPSDARYIHKVLLSWKLGNYRADVTGGEEEYGHDHGGTGGAGGGFSGGSVTSGGAHTPTEQSKAHQHTVTGTLDWTKYYKSGRLITTGNYTEYENNHVHPNPNTGSESDHSHSFSDTSGGPSSTANAVYSLNSGCECSEACGGGYCIVDTNRHAVGSGSHTHYVGGTTGSDGGHSHSIGNTGQQTGLGHRHPISNDDLYRNYMYDICITANLWLTNEEDPAHAHTINYVGTHNDHVTPAVGTHNDHVIVSAPAETIDLTLGIVEEPGGTVMQLTVNGEDVTTIDGDGTDIVITGYCNTGSNTVELAPIVGSNTKGGASLEGRAILFLEAKKF